MRLVCPECAALYEVPSEMIPDEGRDVQCSDCGHNWFQEKTHDEPQSSEENTVSAESPAEESPLATEIDPEHTAQDDPSFTENRDAGGSAPQVDPTPEKQRQNLNPSVTQILREEAQREMQARQRTKETFEPQTAMDFSQSAKDDDAGIKEREDYSADSSPAPQDPSDSDETTAIDHKQDENISPDELSPALSRPERSETKPQRPLEASADDRNGWSGRDKDTSRSAWSMSEDEEETANTPTSTDPGDEWSVHDAPTRKTPWAQSDDDADRPSDTATEEIKDTVEGVTQDATDLFLNAGADSVSSPSDQDDFNLSRENMESDDMPLSRPSAPKRTSTRRHEPRSVIAPESQEPGILETEDGEGRRRDRLPSIDDTTEAWSVVDETQQRAEDIQKYLKMRSRRVGSNLGFTLMLFIIAVMTGVYWKSDEIVARLPQSEPYIERYVAQADNARVILRNQIASAVLSIKQLAQG